MEECKHEMAEHGRRLADYEKTNKSTSDDGSTVAIELPIFFICFLVWSWVYFS